MTWYYKDQEFTYDNIEEGIVGFVYCITNTKTGKQYIGQKKFQKSRRVVSKKKKARRVYSASDWMGYYGSNKLLLEDVAEIGASFFKREILHLCRSKGMMNYLELREQVLHDVLLKPDQYYNSFVGGKIHRIHVLNKP